METPISRPIQLDYMASAMKGTVLTSTGEILATPSPAELVNLFNRSPKVGLNSARSSTLRRSIAARTRIENDVRTGLLAHRPARARGKRGRKRRRRGRTTHHRKPLPPRRVRVRPTHESSKLLQRHLLRRGFVDPRYILSIVHHAVDVTFIHFGSCWAQYQRQRRLHIQSA